MNRFVRIALFLVAVAIGLAILGAVLKALRWLLIIAAVVVVIAGLVAARRERSGA